MDRIRDSNFFGLMIDDSTNVSVIGHVVVFATFIEDRLLISIFLGLLQIANDRKDAEFFFEKLLKFVKERGLDLSKCVAFGSDGCSTMVGRKSGVATRLKEVIILLFQFIALLIGPIWLLCKLLNPVNVRLYLLKLTRLSIYWLLISKSQARKKPFFMLFRRS